MPLGHTAARHGRCSGQDDSSSLSTCRTRSPVSVRFSFSSFESDDSHAVRNCSDQGVQERTKLPVGVQPTPARTASPHDDHQCQRLTVEVFF